MADYSLGEFLAQSMRSQGGGGMGRSQASTAGYLFGPDFMKKTTYLQIADTFVATYGKKVWDALNNRTVFFNAIKKVDWGSTVGWRLRTDRGSGRSQPVTEVGALPTIDVSNYQGVFSYPRTVGTTFGVSLKSQSVSGLEGGIGNQLAVEQEAAARDHIKEINLELLLGNSSIATANDAVAQGEYFRVGDTVADTNSDTAQAITAISGDTLTGLSSSDGRIVYHKTRAGLTSLDDIVEADGRTQAGVSVTNGSDVYNLTTRTANTYSAGNVLDNSGTGRDITLGLVDQAIRTSRQKGGEPKLMLTGLDQHDKLTQLLQAQQRFVDYQDYVVGVGDERTFPGTKGGFTLAAYKGVPILPDNDTAKSVTALDADLGSNFYVLDTDFLELAVMYQTQYIENRDYFAANALVMRGLFFTLMELRCYRPDVQVKICDLST